MADEQNGAPAPAEAGALLDLRDLVQTTQAVATSAGTLQMRLAAALGPLDRVEVAAAWQALGEAEQALGSPPAGATAKQRRQLAERYTAAEDRLLRLILPEATPEQLGQLPQHERSGLGVAFYGAPAETIRRAVALAAAAGAAAPPIGDEQQPASSGSTAATPAAG